MPGDLLSTLLLVFLIVFVFVLIIIGVQVYLILKDTRILVTRLDDLIIEIEKKVNHLLSPVQIITSWFESAKSGWQILDIFRGFVAGLKKRHSHED
jgi:hypothetical protein